MQRIQACIITALCLCVRLWMSSLVDKSAPFCRVLQGHTGWINNVALLRNGRQCVTVSGDGTARVWDTYTGKCLQILEGHSADVTCVVLTSRGRFAVTGSVDGTAQVWDLSAQDVSSVNVHQGKVCT